MKTLLFSAFVLIAAACDAPQKIRYPSESGPVSGLGETTDPGNSFTSGGSDTGGDNGSTGDTTDNSEPGYEECNLAHQYSAGNIGSFGICQNQYDKKQFKINMAQPDVTNGTCFAPMYYQNGKSYNLGRAECVHHQADTTYYGTFTTYRSEPVNAIMVIKYNALNDFERCMGAKNDYYYRRDTSFPQSCMTSPDAYASCVCNKFVQDHQQSYKQVQFY